MIIDCHTHIWQNPAQLGDVELGEISPGQKSRGRRLGPGGKPMAREIPQGDLEEHLRETAEIDKAIVLGFRSRYLNAFVPNDYVSKYVGRMPERLIGFAGIDPTEETWLEDLNSAHNDLSLRGISLSPASQDFHPCDTRAMDLYAQAEKLAMPVVFHPGGKLAETTKLEFGRPYLFDEIARSFPGLRIVIAQLGQPWIDETICLLAKHDNVFADISGLLMRSWPAYNALVTAHQYGVMEKLLFGSDFPYTSPTECIEALYSINQVALGTNLPVVPRESLRGIVERDTLALLGLA